MKRPLSGKAVGTNTVAGSPSRSRIGAARSPTERAASSNVTARVRCRSGGGQRLAERRSPVAAPGEHLQLPIEALGRRPAVGAGQRSLTPW